MLLVYSALHRENLVSKNIYHVLNEVLKSFINVLMPSKLMPNVNVSSSNFVKIKMQTM